MLKRKWNELFERNLSFLNEVSAGIGLLIGYALFGVYWLTTPDTTVEVTTQQVVYEERVIGHVPPPQDVEYLSEIESLERTEPVTHRFPKLTEQGTPVIEEHVVTFTGKGTPQIVVENKEIVQPKLVSDEVRPLRNIHSSAPVSFYLDTILEGTGYYYEDKRVVFDGVMSPDIFAVRIGTLFAFLAIVLLIIRTNAIARAAAGFKSLFKPEENSQPFFLPSGLDSHREDVARFKEKLEKEKHASENEKDDPDYIKQFGLKKISLANERIRQFVSKAKIYLDSTPDPNQYIIGSESEFFIDLNVMRFKSLHRKCFYRFKTVNPLDVDTYTLMDAHILATYLNEKGYMKDAQAVNKIEAVREMLNILKGALPKVEARERELRLKRKKNFWKWLLPS